MSIMLPVCIIIIDVVLVIQTKRIKRIEDCIFHQEYNKETEENNGKN